MKKESKIFEIISSNLTLQNIEAIIDLFEELSKNDNKKRTSYDREPDYIFTLKNGYEYTENNKKDFVDKLKLSSLSKLRSISFNYYREETNLSLDYRRNNFDSIIAKVSSSNKKDYVYYQDRLRELLGSGNWNWIFHNYFSLMVIFIIFSVIIDIFIKISFFKDEPTPIYVYFYPMFFWLLLTSAPADIYPKLIIDLQSQKFGRNIKDDLWKFVLGFFSLILIPIILKKLGIL